MQPVILKKQLIKVVQTEITRRKNLGFWCSTSCTAQYCNHYITTASIGIVSIPKRYRFFWFFDDFSLGIETIPKEKIWNNNWARPVLIFVFCASGHRRRIACDSAPTNMSEVQSTVLVGTQ